MNVEAIKAMMAKKGLAEVKHGGVLAGISVDGGFILGRYEGSVVYEDKEEKDPAKRFRNNHRITILEDGEGFGSVGKDAKPAPMKAGEYTVFGCYDMDDKILGRLGTDRKTRTGGVEVGATVGLVYEGKRSFTPKGSKKSVKAHNFSMSVEPVKKADGEEAAV